MSAPSTATIHVTAMSLLFQPHKVLQGWDTKCVFCYVLFRKRIQMNEGEKRESVEG